jgi:beta-barrel assembly-enhancing protease
MTIKKIIFGIAVLSLVPTLNGCDTIKKSVDEFNTYSLGDDLTLGKQTAAQIASKPAEFPILPEAQYAQVYAYVNQIKDNILSTGKVRTAKVFPYELKIINDDKTLNAFCTPGGFVYVYTGLIKFLDSEDQLAGVIGHEIGHADKRHSTRQLTKMMPLDMIGQVLTSTDKGPVSKETQGVIAQVATSLIGLKFSRDHETEADQASVDYLCGTPYNADGAAAFFQKIQGKGGTPPEFMSTHPNPKNRVLEIKKRKALLKCSGDSSNDAEYARIKRMLP